MKSAWTAGMSFATGGDCSHPRARSGTRTATAAIDFVFMAHLRPLDEYNRRHVDQPQRPRDDAPFPVIRVGPGIEREGPWSLQAIAHRAARPTIAARALCLNRDLPRGLDVLCRRREGERLRRIVASVAARGVKLTDVAGAQTALSVRPAGLRGAGVPRVAARVPTPPAGPRRVRADFLRWSCRRPAGPSHCNPNST